jgi:hypothetical protein
VNIRWKRWAGGAVGLLAAYTVAGFWLVPLVIKNQVPKLGQTELARQATIGEVSFNPYSLRLEGQDLRLAEADGAPLLAIGKLAVELQWRSLVRRAWSFAEIRMTAPSASLAIAADGKFNFAELLATLERRPREASADSSLPRLIIGRFTLEQGTLELRDRRAGYANSFSPIDFVLTNFSTLPDQNDSYTFSADSVLGGKLRWKGEASVNPIRGSGELILENAPLRELAVYLKSYTRATLAAGQLAATLPYRFAYSDGKLEASLAGAKVALRDLALAHEGGASDSFATLTHLDVSGINADLARREATVDELRADGGKLTVRRDAKGELDLANLLVTAAGPAAAAGPGQPAVINNWKLTVKQVVFDQVAISAVDETVSPPLKLSADKAQLRLQLAAEQVGADFKLTVADAAFSLADLALASGTQTPFKLAQLGFTDGAVDLSARRASLGRLYAEGGQLQLARDPKGQLNILGMLPKFGAAGQQGASPAAPARAQWIAVAKSVELSKFGAEVEDQGTGAKIHVQDLAVKLEGAGSDFTQPVKFDAGLSLREGGQLSAHGNVVPASGALAADVQVKQLQLAPLEPLLGEYVKLKIAGGSVSAQGRLTTSAGGAKSPRLRYVGGLDIASLVLNEESGELFAAWKSAGTDKLTASLAPDLLEIAELRVVEADAKLIIENDRSFNAARLLVRPAASDATDKAPTPAQPTGDPFPVRIQRLRLQDAKLDFADLSLRPQFGAKIYELNGLVTGLSSSRDSRSRIELDGRVEEFGLVRVRGELNPFAPSDNTEVNVVFKNVDMVPVSPYSMKFAGYKIAEGKISLDLQYKVRNSQLEGANQIVIDKLTLGERVDSPDALKLPLELAIAILKDSEGRIELGLPVSGNMSDPQFSYGAVVWKAIGSVLTKIVSAPFRALGGMLGVSGEKLEVIDFDPGSDRVLPPEREKLKQVAQLLSKRPQLKLSVPGQYSEAADGAALKARAVRIEIAKRAGIKLEAGEDPGPLDLRARAVRGALRDLYAERFGAAELDKQKKAAESGATVLAGAPAAKEPNSEPARENLPLWQRAALLVQGEQQVADASAFYHKLQERLDQNQPLAADALTQLGAQRASAILAAMKEAGVDPARALAAPPEKVTSEVGKPVPLKLGLAAR